ncbi:MAG: hypothetical protein ABJO01_04145 [Parasphingorhabdus sp.]|uniref:hypothetical protein n=1 Tax=Parasphingorhabdus sp. TaxID=2709688 RepID=UPI0032992449
MNKLDIKPGAYFAIYIALFAILCRLYLIDIVPTWGYYGFVGAVDLWKVLLSICFFIFWAIAFRPKPIVSDMVILFGTFLYILPSFVMYSVGGGTNFAQMLVVGSISLVLIISRARVTRPKMDPISQPTMFGIILVFTIVSMGAQVAYGGLKTFNLNLLEVYNFRAEAASNIPSIFGYIISPTGKILLPMGFVLSAYFKNRTMAIVFAVLTITYFGLSQHKSILFGPIAVYFIYLATLKFGKINSIIFFFLAVSFVLVANHLYYFSSSANGGLSFINSIVLRRTFFIPPLLDSLYLEFFANTSKYYWSSSSITFGLIENPYHVNAPKLIGQEYFQNPDVSANAGIVASGYSNAGIVGVLIYSAVFGLILSMLNSHGRHIGHEFVFSVSLTVCVSIMTSTDIVTSILTHGMMLLLILLMFFPVEENHEKGAAQCPV